MARPAALLFLLPLIAPLGGCSSASDDDKYSDNYRLAELNGSYGAFADETNLDIFVAFLGPKGFTRLRGGDTLEVAVNDVRVATMERVIEDKVHYIVRMPPPPGETEVSVTFVRGLERVARKMKLTGAFNIPAAPTTIKLGQSAELDVDPRPDLSKWPGPFGPTLVARAEVTGDCLESGSQQIPLCAASSSTDCKQGYPLKLDAAKLLLLPGSKGCAVDVQVRLTSSAGPFEALGPSRQTFKGGGWDGHRLKTIKLALTE